MGNQTENSEREETKKTSTPNESGDPGRTPGSAEGDRETVEQDLKDKNVEGDDKKSAPRPKA